MYILKLYSVMSDSSSPMDCSLPGSSAHGIFQARILEWSVISYSGNLSVPGIKPTCLMSPALADFFFFFLTTSAAWEVPVLKSYRFSFDPHSPPATVSFFCPPKLQNYTNEKNFPEFPVFNLVFSSFFSLYSVLTSNGF